MTNLIIRITIESEHNYYMLFLFICQSDYMFRP